MNVRDIMSRDPSCCTPETNLVECAQIMLRNDVGEIPVVRDDDSKQIVGVITDRDIVVRAVARNINPSDVKIQEVMTDDLVTVSDDASIDDVGSLMRDRQVRRVPVVDTQRNVVGIVSLADVTRSLDAQRSGEIVRDISQPEANVQNLDNQRRDTSAA